MCLVTKCVKCGNDDWVDEKIGYSLHGETGHEPEEMILATCSSCDHVQVIA